MAKKNDKAPATTAPVTEATQPDLPGMPAGFKPVAKAPDLWIPKAGDTLMGRFARQSVHAYDPNAKAKVTSDRPVLVDDAGTVHVLPDHYLLGEAIANLDNGVAVWIRCNGPGSRTGQGAKPLVEYDVAVAR